MLVLGLTGKIGCGKDTVSRYLEREHGFRSISMGDIVREYVREEGLEMTRENQQKIGTGYREKHGKDFFAREVARKIGELPGDRFVINGVRAPHDVKVPRKRFDEKFCLIQITSPAEDRFQRMKGRSRPGDPETFEEFKEQEESDIEKFNQDETFEMADYEIKNDGSLDELFEKVGRLIDKLEEDVEED
ncbi:MAG: AAA family ATPase [Candidatus Aenigmatarchaeota archaeon]